MGILKRLSGQTYHQPTLFAVDTLANRSRSPQATEKAKQTNDTCGRGFETPYAIYDPAMQYWRTYKATSHWEQLPLLEKLPTSGICANGVLYLRRVWERVTKETDYLLWPTPVARGGLDGGAHSRASMKKLENTQYEVPTTGKMNPTWVEWLMGFPPEWTDLED